MRYRAAAALIEPGQHQEILGQRGQPEGVLEDVARGLPPVLGVRVIECDLELGPDAGDGTAQFVRGV